MEIIKLSIYFLEDVDDEIIKKIYDVNYLGRGRELGEATFSSEGKLKKISISPYETKEGEEEGKLSINDFTTYLVLKYKIQQIKTESERIEKKEDPKVEETECEECKVDLEK